MIDIALIREKPEWVKQQLHNLQDAPAVSRIDQILALDQRRRALIHEAETLQAVRNKLNKAVGSLRSNRSLSPGVMAQAAAEAIRALDSGDYTEALDVLAQPRSEPQSTAGSKPKDASASAPDPAGDPKAALDALSTALRSLGDRVESLSKEADAAEAEQTEHMLWIPNMPHPSVKIGKDDSENIICPPEGELRQFAFTPKAHWDLGPELDIIDFDRGVRLSGSRFYVLKGMGARLQRALINFFLDLHHTKHGFTEVYTPFMVKEACLIGSAQFPKFRDVVYNDPEAELFMLPTAEVSIANLHRDEILEHDQLPLYYMANTPCWRWERTSAGRDVRGIKRVHQFQKVEMFKFVTPETSYAELESLVEAAADVCRALQLPFRRIEQVTGDLGFAAAKKYDLEIFAPGCDEWLEVSSCSNCEAFQARRAAIRYRPTPGAKPEFVHTLNGSGLALPRVLIAILENNQQADGSVVIPEVLRPYLGGQELITSG